jgi:hypothetical protein
MPPSPCVLLAAFLLNPNDVHEHKRLRFDLQWQISSEFPHVRAPSDGYAIPHSLAVRRDKGHPACLQVDEAGPSTSAPSKKQPIGSEEDHEDLQIAWEVTDLARVVLLKNKGNDHVTPELLMELYETLGDLGTERDDYESAKSDYAEVNCIAIQSFHPLVSREIQAL